MRRSPQNIFPSPWKGEGEGGGARGGVPRQRCARPVTSPPHPHPCPGCAKSSRPRSAGKRSTGPFPVSASPPFKGEGEKIRRLQAAHGVIGAFEALTQYAPGFAGGHLTLMAMPRRISHVIG